LSNSISDDDIINCNRIFWLKKGPLESQKLWNITKEIGSTYSGDEVSILNKLEEMEQRDKKLKQKIDEGKHNGDK